MLITSYNEHDYSLNILKPEIFTSFVSRGKLILCSTIAFKVICAAEKAFKLFMFEKKIMLKVI